MRRILVLANQTLGGYELDLALRKRITDAGAQFFVLVPMIKPELEASWVPADTAFGLPVRGGPGPGAINDARRRSQRRLDLMVDRITAWGAEATGEVSGSDPMVAVKDLLERERFDEVIVSTLPAGISRWLKMDLPSRLARSIDIPVVPVEAEV